MPRKHVWLASIVMIIGLQSDRLQSPDPPPLRRFEFVPSVGDKMLGLKSPSFTAAGKLNGTLTSTEAIVEALRRYGNWHGREATVSLAEPTSMTSDLPDRLFRLTHVEILPEVAITKTKIGIPTIVWGQYLHMPDDRGGRLYDGAKVYVTVELTPSDIPSRYWESYLRIHSPDEWNKVKAKKRSLLERLKESIKRGEATL